MKEELNYDDRKHYAHELYTKNAKTIQDIAFMLGIDKEKVKLWAQQDFWDKEKRSLLISKTTQLECLYSTLEGVSNSAKEANNINPKDLDQIVKLTTSIKNLESEASVSTIIEVAEMFINWLRPRDLNLTKRLIVHMDAFVKQKLAA